MILCIEQEEFKFRFPIGCESVHSPLTHCTLGGQVQGLPSDTQVFGCSNPLQKAYEHPSLSGRNLQITHNI